MAIFPRCSIIIGVCPNAVTRSGVPGITSIVMHQMAVRQRRGFSEVNFQISLKTCWHRLRRCLVLVSGNRLKT